MARHRRTSLNELGIADFDEFIHKKIPYNCYRDVVMKRFHRMLWPAIRNVAPCVQALSKCLDRAIAPPPPHPPLRGDSDYRFI